MVLLHDFLSSFSHIACLLSIPSQPLPCIHFNKILLTTKKEREVKMAYKTTAGLPSRPASQMSTTSRSSSRMSSASTAYSDSDSEVYHHTAWCQHLKHRIDACTGCCMAYLECVESPRDQKFCRVLYEYHQRLISAVAPRVCFEVELEILYLTTF